MPFNQSYKFNKSDTNKIYAIANFNKNVIITNIIIGTENTPLNIKGSDLPEHINTLNSDENIEIICESEDGVSAVDVLPPLSDLAAVNAEANQNGLKSTVANNLLTSNQSSIDPLTFEQAVLLLNAIHHKSHYIAGAVHLPALDTIVFQLRYEGMNYVLNYKDGKVIKWNDFNFDVDRGFVSDSAEFNAFIDKAIPLILDNDNNDSQIKSPTTVKVDGISADYLKNVCNELNKFFLKWVENQYQNEVIQFEKNTKGFSQLYRILITSEQVNYIAAIAQFNKNIRLVAVNGVKIENKKGSDLRGILSELIADGTNKATVKSDSLNGESTIDIFPPLTHLQDEVQKYNFDDNEIKIAEKTADKVIGYLVGISMRDQAMGPNPTPATLSEIENLDQVFLMLSELGKIMNISGVVHLESRKAILFQHIEDCKSLRGKPYQSVRNYILNYNDRIPTVEAVVFEFDVDEGFSTRLSGIYQNICEDLNIDFRKWKENDYKGNLIPTEMTKFEFKRLPIELTSEECQNNNKLLYSHQKKERWKHYAWIVFDAILTTIFAITLVFIPLAIYLGKRMVAHIDANKKADENMTKIITVARSQEDREEIRGKRRAAKIFASVSGDYITKDKPFKVSVGEVVKYVTRSKAERDLMFSAKSDMLNIENNPNFGKNFSIFKNYKEKSKKENLAVLHEVRKLRQ